MTQELTLERALREVSSEWADFRERARIHSPYLRPDYLALWASTMDRSLQCRAIVARRGGELVGFGPFMVVRDPFGPFSLPGLHFVGNNVGCPGDVTYTDIAASKPAAPVVRSILEHARSWRLSKWDLGYLSPSSDTRALASEILGPRSEEGAVERQSFASRALPRHGDVFMKEINENVRKNYRRRLRRLNEIGPIVVRTARAPSLVRRTVGEMIRNHERWWTGTGREDWLGGRQEKDFLLKAADLLAGEGAFLAFALEVNGMPIAWNIGAFDGKRYFEHLMSFDRSHKQYAPGVLLEILIAEQLIELGAEKLELGPGFDDRKRRIGATAIGFERLKGYRGWPRALVRLHHMVRPSEGSP